jgi:hypothetical protein
MQKVALYTRQNGSRKYVKVSAKASFGKGTFPPGAVFVLRYVRDGKRCTRSLRIWLFTERGRSRHSPRCRFRALHPRRNQLWLHSSVGGILSQEFLRLHKWAGGWRILRAH